MVRRPRVVDKTSIRKPKIKYHLWKQYLETKDAKIYQNLLEVWNQIQRSPRKAAREQEKNFTSNVKCNRNMFWNYSNSDTKLRPGIPDYLMMKKQMEKSKNNFEKAEVPRSFFQVYLLTSVFFSSVFIKRQSCHHIGTSQLVSRANQLTGFYMIATLAFNELRSCTGLRREKI